MTLVNPLPFARLATIGLYPHIAAHSLSGHTAADSSVGCQFQVPGEGPPFAADAPVGISAPVAKALAAKQAITDLGNMTPPPSSRLYSENGPSLTFVIHAFQKNPRQKPSRG